MNPNVNIFFTSGCGRCSLFDTPKCKVHTWTKELTALRNIILETNLTEELKWGVPCYTFNKKNLIMIGAYKDNCVISFVKGALLKDEKKILTMPGENSQSARVVRFTNIKDIIKLESSLKKYIKEAIELEKTGVKVNFKKPDEFVLPNELLDTFKEIPELKTAFYALTPGRQRGYILHFSQAKQSTTRLSRIEKCIPQIMKGKGMMD